MKKSRSEEHPLFNFPATPLLIVLSGPSGAGKDAVLSRIKESGSLFEHITTVTTRPQRPEERDMLDYHFVSQERFREMLEKGELLESARVYGNWYGVPKRPVKEALDRGKDVIIKVDIQGAATIKKIQPQAVFIFLTLPSPEELAQRLRERNTEKPFDLAFRLETAEEEMKQLPLFDYVVLNRRGKIDLAVSQIKAIITAEKCRLTQRKISF